MNQKWLSANKLKLNVDKTELFCLPQALCMQNLMIFFQLIYLVIFFYLLRWLGTLVSDLIQIFLSLAVSGIPIRLVFSYLGISEGISHVKLLFWLHTPW